MALVGYLVPGEGGCGAGQPPTLDLSCDGQEHNRADPGSCPGSLQDHRFPVILLIDIKRLLMLREEVY